MANQGFVQALNLAEVEDGSLILDNLAGGTASNDLKIFQGVSTKKSLLFFNRFVHTAVTEESGKSLELGTQFIYDSVYTYTDDDIVDIVPINLLKDYDIVYRGFDSDGKLTFPNSGKDITFSRGDGYLPGKYEVIFKGGSGLNESAEATIEISDGQNVFSYPGLIGQIGTVEITDSGDTQGTGTSFTGFKQGDVLTISKYRQIIDENGNTTGNTTYISGDLPPRISGIPGTGFQVTIIGYPWTALLVGNYTWDIANFDTALLRVEIANTNASLNGTYDLVKDATTNKHKFVPPSSPTTKSYDVNRLIYAQEFIERNVELYDVSGDGSLTSWDIDLLEVFFRNTQNFPASTFEDDVKDWIADYITANGLPSGSTRTNEIQLYNYMEGLNRSIMDVDGTNPTTTTIPATAITLLRNYVTGNGTLYSISAASTLINSATINASSLSHAIAVRVPVREFPIYTLDTEGYAKPYFLLTVYNSSSGGYVNHFNQFAKFGRKMTCTTTLNSWISIPIGASGTSSGIDWKISDKFTGTNTDGSALYYVNVVASGDGFAANSTFSSYNLTVQTSTPVINTADNGTEYGVFDSNGQNTYFLRSLPRSTQESLKEIILIAENYSIPTSESTTYGGTKVPTTTLFPDVIFRRDDKLTVENIQNLESPEVLDNEESNSESYGSTGSFSYGIDEGYTVELENVSENVEQATYLKDSKYRIDRKLYYERDIKIEGLITAFDPDGFNSTEAALSPTDDDVISPGIYISDAGSQITNNLRSDFAGKTRSFSNDYNPWVADPDNGQLLTTSTEVSINDLIFSQEVSIDLRRDGQTTDNTRFVNGNGALGETLADNYAVNPSNPTSFKLKMVINNEEFYILMKKV